MIAIQNISQLVKIGITINKEGGVKTFNGNLYADYILERYDLLFSIDGSFYYYSDGVYTCIEDEVLKRQLAKDFDEVAPNMWTSGYERAYLESLKFKVFYDGQLNPYKTHINLQNGMLNLNSRKLFHHNKKYVSTVQLPFRYKSTATCPAFQQFLADVFENDEERIRLAQEWLGYLLTFETKAQKALILYGSGGNGKGVFCSIIEALIGRENISYESLADLSNEFHRATLFDKQLILSTENEIKTLNTQTFKQIVGADTSITAAHKNKKPFSFFPVCKIVLSTNNLPDTRDRSEGYYRRLSFLHFSRHFSDKEKNVDQAKTLLKELPGILNFALDGLQRLRQNDYHFSSCASSDALLKEYRIEQNPFIEFVSECLHVGNEQSKEENRVVYTSFKHWCNRNGHRAFAGISSKKFWRELDNAIALLGMEPPKRRNSGNHRYCHGISIKQDYRYTDEF